MVEKSLRNSLALSQLSCSLEMIVTENPDRSHSFKRNWESLKSYIIFPFEIMQFFKHDLLDLLFLIAYESKATISQKGMKHKEKFSGFLEILKCILFPLLPLLSAYCFQSDNDSL